MKQNMIFNGKNRIMVFFGVWLTIAGIIPLIGADNNLGSNVLVCVLGVLTVPSTLLYQFGLSFLHPSITMSYINAANAVATGSAVLAAVIGLTLLALFIKQRRHSNYITKRNRNG